jgi:hypothetical protein
MLSERPALTVDSLVTCLKQASTIPLMGSSFHEIDTAAALVCADGAPAATLGVARPIATLQQPDESPDLIYPRAAANGRYVGWEVDAGIQPGSDIVPIIRSYVTDYWTGRTAPITGPNPLTEITSMSDDGRWLTATSFSNGTAPPPVEFLLDRLTGTTVSLPVASYPGWFLSADGSKAVGQIVDRAVLLDLRSRTERSYILPGGSWGNVTSLSGTGRYAAGSFAADHSNVRPDGSLVETGFVMDLYLGTVRLLGEMDIVWGLSSSGRRAFGIGDSNNPIETLVADVDTGQVLAREQSSESALSPSGLRLAVQGGRTVVDIDSKARLPGPPGAFRPPKFAGDYTLVTVIGSSVSILDVP